MSRVCVVGAGLMGHGIAQVFLAAGWEVQVFDRDSDALAAVPERIREHLRQLGQEPTGSLHLAGSLADGARDAELIVEAIPEDLALKQQLCGQLDEIAPEAVIATNTSVLRIGEIAAGSARPGRVVGAHRWNPPYLIPVVEVTPADDTHPDTTEQVLGWLSGAGKTPVLLHRDVPGFVGNRLQFALWREALHLVQEGICDATTVDLVARNTFGRRLGALGPIENADYIGLDLTAAIMTYLLPHLSADSTLPAVLHETITRGRLGAKTGQGLLSWPSGRREETERRLLEHLVQERI